MTFYETPSDAIRNVPDALLLDFGGVIFETKKDPAGKRILAERVRGRLAATGIELPLDSLERSLAAGLTALKHWKHAQSRRIAPAELAPREIVGDFLVSDLPDAARALLIAEASDVLVDVTTTLSSHAVRPGILDLLDLADARGIPVGIVSNAHSGRSHREVLARHGLDERFVVQCYSDEVGLRKPHPGIIALAAEACGTTADRCWYVGDTQDRDVVAGRRAGVGAVILTRSHHTDAPPFAVAERADAVYDTPEGLVGALRAAIADPAGPTPPAGAEPTCTAGPTPPGGSGRPDAGATCTTTPELHSDPRHAADPAAVDRIGVVVQGRGRALLIDHGGVISSSTPDPALLREFCAWLARLVAPPRADTAEPALDAAEVARLIERARDAHRAFKHAIVRRHAKREDPLIEADPVEFWRDWFGSSLSERRRAVLTAEAHDIMARYGRAKSRRTLRDGVRQLLEACRAEAVPVVVVSNTLSGRAVREVCAEHGIAGLVAASVCSDEVGLRKPDAALVHEALRIARADPAQSVFLGDKPQNDAVAARRAGIAERVLVRGGSTADADLADALASGLATRVLDHPGDLVALIRSIPAVPVS
ncbi:HAD-IA family hydrolase [Microbacterium suaedae]|uniref:HAD-IA family hydrolase n=1 Tax=Microbacterium suaedae TaxID=2067813 RepID=UPI000DA24D5B|nr:HAD-IA family hydrolase [Microbacterium suaedae]